MGWGIPYNPAHDELSGAPRRQELLDGGGFESSKSLWAGVC